MRILLADDQLNVRFGLCALLEQRSGLDVVGEATDVDDLLAQAKMTYPDLVLLSYELPGQAMVDLLPALRKVCPNVCVIVLSGQPEARQAASAVGADAFVSKADPPEQLLAAIMNYQHERSKK